MNKEWRPPEPKLAGRLEVQASTFGWTEDVLEDGTKQMPPEVRTTRRSISRQNSKFSESARSTDSPSAWHTQRTGPPVALLEDMAMRADGHGLSQGLSSILNAPTLGVSSSGAGLGMAGWSWPFAGTDLPLTVPGPDPALLPPVTMRDFKPYLNTCAGAQSQFQATFDAEKARAAKPGKTFSPGDGVVEALKTVPQMLFDEHFSLARPETWEKVVSTADEEQRLARLEEYSLYVDTVESEILKEIAALQAHSTQFFEASTLLQELRASLQRAHLEVTNTRQRLATHCKEMQKAAIEVVKRKQQRANMEAVLQQLKVVEEVASAQQTLALLLPQGDFSAALDVMDSLASVVASQQTAGLKAFLTLGDFLEATRQGIKELLHAEFLRASKFPKRVPRLRSPPEQTTRRLDQGYAVEQLAGMSAEQKADLQDEMAPVVEALIRTEDLPACLAAVHSSAAASIKDRIRDTVEHALVDLAHGRQPQKGVTEQLQTLGPDEFLVLLACVQEVARSHMQHVKSIHGCVTAILKGSKTGRSILPEVDSSFKQILQAVSETTHSRWMKLLSSRADVVNSLDLPALKALLGASARFGECMAEEGARPIPALQTACQAQGRNYLEYMHRAGLMQLTAAMDRDTWVVVDCPPSCQALVDSLCIRAGSVKTSTQNGNQTSHTTPEADSGKLRINGRTLYTVSSFQHLLEAIKLYLQFLDTVPALTAEASHRLLELCKAYNSRMCQLVLGAGALQAAGLKSITAKHLAVSCQCVTSLMELQPVIGAVLYQALPTTRKSFLASDLNLLAKDLVTHRTEVHNKLVGIMRERLIASLTQLPALAQRWTALPPNAATPSAFATSLAKQLHTLSQVLTRILTEEEVHLIFARIASLFSKNLAEAFSRLAPLGLGWEVQCRADLRHLLATLQGLPVQPSLQASSTERLQALLQTRFAPLNETSAAVGATVPTSPARPSLAARLGTAKMALMSANGNSSTRETNFEESPVRELASQRLGSQPARNPNSQESSSPAVHAHARHGSDISDLALDPIDNREPAAHLEASSAIDTDLTDTDNFLGKRGELPSQSDSHQSRQEQNSLLRDPEDLQDVEIERQEQSDAQQHLDHRSGHLRESKPAKEQNGTLHQATPLRRPPRETAESILEAMEHALHRRTFEVDSRSQSFQARGTGYPVSQDSSRTATDASGVSLSATGPAPTSVPSQTDGEEARQLDFQPDSRPSGEQHLESQTIDTADSSAYPEGDVSQTAASLSGSKVASLHEEDASVGQPPSLANKRIADGAEEASGAESNRGFLGPALSPRLRADESSTADWTGPSRSNKIVTLEAMLKTIQAEDWARD